MVSPVRVSVSPFVSLDLLDTKPEEADEQVNRSLALATADKYPEQAVQIKIGSKSTHPVTVV